MSENKKKVKENTSKAQSQNSTKGQKQVSGQKKTPDAPEKTGLAITAKNLPFIVIAAILVVVIIGAVVIAVVNYATNDPDFDYLTSDLSKYIKFTDDYKNFSVNVDIAKPREDDVKIAILNMLYADRDKNPLNNGGVVSNGVITPGDEVLIWYRGYLVGDGDEKTVVAGLSNFGNESPVTLGIGSNGMYPGFELNLVNVNTKDYPKFEKITSGIVSEGQIAYISYTKTKGDDKNTKIEEKNVRLDFSEDVDATFGAGFAEKIVGLEIGKKVDISATVDGTVYNYTDLTVNFVTECEVNPIIVEAYVAYDYEVAEYRNENLVFEVYIDGIVEYSAPEFTDEYLKNKIEKEELNVTLEELEEFGKDSLVANYYAYADKLMNELYEEEKRALVEAQIWTHYVNVSVGLKYPKTKVDEVYNDYLDDIIDQYNSSGGYVYDYAQVKYVTCSSVDEFAPIYLRLSSGADWKAEVYKQSQGFIKERMVMFYILRAENLLPTDEELYAERDAIYQEYLDEAIKQYFDYDGKTREDYTDEEYEKIVEKCEQIVYFNFEENYFIIRAYYNILAETAVNWPEVITLDERRAYPQDK